LTSIQVEQGIEIGHRRRGDMARIFVIFLDRGFNVMDVLAKL
jgi:hypothetical protein